MRTTFFRESYPMLTNYLLLNNFIKKKGGDWRLDSSMSEPDGLPCSLV